MGMKNNPITPTFDNNGRIDLFVQIHGEHLAAHLHLHALDHEIAERIPEKEPKDHAEHGQQDVGDRRNEVAAQLLSANDPCISHCSTSRCRSLLVFSGIIALR